ncbi:M15 family metallopeptidase [Neobacillus niacini]|uniref:M15 family metallopeptidase n=1 Tax=Neobacillus niacini TaxID=86668 RepID=UPI00285A04B7|nr:M15 family metallopeptidase [Neobacillus niacini]MDR7002826.1 peptidoglycan L-alanyl-D-glutamate endopeptidase CwlK [Neobacillus niacini]
MIEMKGNMVLKLKRFGSFMFILILAIFVYLYIVSQMQSEKQSVSLPNGLNPIVKEGANQLIRQSAKKGITVVITDGFRSMADQDQLYKKGRTSGGTIVTKAKGGESFHNYGLAVDFALKTPSAKVIWDRNYDGNQNGKPDWDEVVAIAKSLGFQWGGDWAQFKDYPHLQMDFGLTLAELQNGKRPPKSYENTK